jgi:branched-chain amino acid transport system substrate-binding protein
MKDNMRQLFAALLGASALTVGIASAADSTIGVEKDKIKIGVMGPMSGPAAVFGKAVFGVEALYKRVNDEGGIHGRKIELIREDTACDPAKGLAAYRKLVSQDRVFAINGGLCSSVVLALKPEIVKANIPFVTIGAVAGGISNPVAPTLFQSVATGDEVARTMIDFAMTRPATKKLAFVGPSDEWGKSNIEPALAHLKKQYGLEPTQLLTMEKGSTDATPHILKIRAAGADVVVAMMYPAEMAIFLRDAYKYGLKLPVLAPQSISLEDTRARAGTAAAVQNLYVYYPYVAPFDSPEMKQWAALIAKYYPEERIENFSFLGMGGTLALLEALKKAGPELTREKFVAAMDATHNLETGVLGTTLSFSPTNHAGVRGGNMATFKGDKVVVLKAWQ